jgi:hypothetical protein
VKPKGLGVGDRVTLKGDVLRVLGGEERSLLVLIEGSADKVVIKSSWFDRGDKLRGGDPVTMAATVTRVAEGPYNEFTPVSVQIDGYTASRVTLASKWLTPIS